MKTSFKFGDIYLVKFHPAYGQELKRYRPAVVASTVANQIDSRFTTICPLSTKIKPKLSAYELQLDSKTPGIDCESILISWYIRTVDTNRLQSKIGELIPLDKNKFKQQLTNIFS